MNILFRISKIIESEVKKKLAQILSEEENKFKRDNFNEPDEEGDFTFHNKGKTHGKGKAEGEANDGTNRSNDGVGELQKHLDLFELGQPVDHRELKKRRNQILLKYHPDRFGDDLEKQRIAKELVQTYNESYFKILEMTKKN